MQKNRSYAIIGSGAIGSYYGAMLDRAGFDVHFLFHSAYSHVLNKGLTIKEKNGDLVLPSINAYSNVQDMPPCDVIIIALKTTQNEMLINLLPHLLKKNTIILTMQNGLGSEEAIASITKNHSILSGIVTLGAFTIDPGIIQLTHTGAVKLAIFSDVSQAKDAAQLIAKDFAIANILNEIHGDYLLIRWLKLLWNIPFNGLCLTQQTTADLLANNYASQLQNLANEVIAIAAAYNKEIPLERFDKMISETKKLIGFKTSMVYDFEHHNPLEIEYLFANPIAAAKAKNIPCPLLENLYKNLRELDLKNRNISHV